MPSVSVGQVKAGASADIGAVADAAVTNPAASASIIAALKGIIKQLQGGGTGDTDVDVTDRAARDLGKVDIAGIDAVGTIAGQKAMAASVPVVLASDQSNVPVTLATTLSSAIDSIDIAKMSKGSVTTAHNAITTTTTSTEIDCRGFNTISVEMSCSALSAGNWVASILGCAISGGTFGPCFTPKDDGTFVAQATPAISANGNTTYYFKGIPNYVEILATRTTDGTLTCKVTPMNL